MKYTELSPEEIRENVFKEAKKQFLKRGIIKTELKQIARTVGIGRTTLYRYFPMKEQLIFLTAHEIVKKYFYCYLMQKEDLPLNINGYEKLRIFCYRFCETLVEDAPKLVFLAEFDGMFRGEYPDIIEAKQYETDMRANMCQITKVIEEARIEGSINVLEGEEALIASVLVNTIMGIGMRTITREIHYEKEHANHSKKILDKTVEMLLRSINSV